MPRRSARAIVINNDRLLVMFRNKFGSKYVTLPGGLIEVNEQAADCALRELIEETSVKAIDPQLVFIDRAEFYGDQLIFLCKYVSGEPKISEDSHEFEINKLGKNLYQPAWLAMGQLKSVPFLSAELQQAICVAFTSGWPNEPLEFTSARNVQ